MFRETPPCFRSFESLQEERPSYMLCIMYIVCVFVTEQTPTELSKSMILHLYKRYGTYCTMLWGLTNRLYFQSTNNDDCWHSIPLCSKVVNRLNNYHDHSTSTKVISVDCCTSQSHISNAHTIPKGLYSGTCTNPLNESNRQSLSRCLRDVFIWSAVQSICYLGNSVWDMWHSTRSCCVPHSVQFSPLVIFKKININTTSLSLWQFCYTLTDKFIAPRVTNLCAFPKASKFVIETKDNGEGIGNTIMDFAYSHCQVTWTSI